MIEDGKKSKTQLEEINGQWTNVLLMFCVCSSCGTEVTCRWHGGGEIILHLHPGTVRWRIRKVELQAHLMKAPPDIICCNRVPEEHLQKNQSCTFSFTPRGPAPIHPASHQRRSIQSWQLYMTLSYTETLPCVGHCHLHLWWHCCHCVWWYCHLYVWGHGHLHVGDTAPPRMETMSPPCMGTLPPSWIEIFP